MSAFSPSQIQIETTTACNAKCKMCPRDVQVRGHGVMPEDTFWSVVDQAYEIGIRTMLPFMDGEPLADHRMVRFVSTMAVKYPDVTVGWYTNASLLTKDKAAALLKAGNIKQFNVSIQGGTKEVYEDSMGLDWERTIDNVNALISVNESLGRPSVVKVHMCVFSKTKDTIAQFVEMWQGKAAVCLAAFSNFGGMVSDEYGEKPWRDKPRLVCDRATQHLYVYWNGDVGQCCFDLLGSITYGNVNTTRLNEISSSAKHEAMRASHHQLNVAAMPAICRSCNACKFHG